MPMPMLTRTVRQNNDRSVIAGLVMRFERIRETLPDGPARRHIDIKDLSPRQMELIQEALLGTLTSMNLRGYCWMRDAS